MKEKDEIKDLFAGALDSYEADVPEAAWANIQAALAPKKRRAIPLWWKGVAAAALIAGIGLIAYTVLQNSNSEAAYTARNATSVPVLEAPLESDEGLMAKDVKSPEQENGYGNEAFSGEGKTTLQGIDTKAGSKPSNEPDNGILPQNDEKQWLSNTPASNKQQTGLTNIVNKNQEEPIELPVQDLTNQNDSTSTQPEVIPQNAPVVEEEDKPEQKAPQFTPPPIELLPSEDADHGFLAANLSSGLGNVGNTQKSIVFTSAQEDAFALDQNTNSAESQGFAYAVETLDINSTQQLTWPANNSALSPPLSLGLTRNVGIGRKWGIESGLNYTLLSSSTVYEQGRLNTRANFIGAPVVLNYWLGKGNKRWRMAVNAGLQADLALSSRAKFRSTDPDYADNTITAKGGGLQLSRQVGLSASYTLSEKASIYLLPAFTDYFKPANNSFNYLQDQRFWAKFTAGIRIGL